MNGLLPALSASGVTVFVVPAGLSGPWPFPAPQGAVPGGWPLHPVPAPEVAGAALALVLPSSGAAFLWDDRGDAGWLGRCLRAAGVTLVDLILCAAGTKAAGDVQSLRTTLQLAGLRTEIAKNPVHSFVPGARDAFDAALARNAVLADAMPQLLAQAVTAGQPAEAAALRNLARQVADRLFAPQSNAAPDPLPDTAEALAAALWPALSAAQILPELPVYDPVRDGPAGLNGRRITFVIEKLADRSGGAERVLIETANALADRGYMVEILSHEHRGKPPFYATKAGVLLANLRPRREQRSRIRRLADMVRAALERVLPDVFPFDRLVWLSRNGGFYRRLGHHLRATRPDAVIAFMPPAVTALALAAPDLPCRRIASMHNAPEQDFDNSARWDPSRLGRRRRRAAMARMDVIAVLLEEHKDWYPASLRSKTQVIPNAVVPHDAAQLAAVSRQPVVLAVGRLASVKRHDLLVATWAGLAPRFPGWELRIFGDGPLRDTLETLVAELGLPGKVRLMGHTSDIRKEYLGAALLAHPAEFEGFPLAVTEALAAGLPVVGFSDCSGLNRLVHNGVNGALVEETGDQAKRTVAFAAALEDLMAKADRRADLSAAAPASVAAYTPDRVLDLWEATISGMTESQDTKGKDNG